MFDPNEHGLECERYLARYLECRVDFIHATRLVQSSRAAPWRLDVRMNGFERSFVLQLDERGLEHEYLVLKAMEAIAIPTPRVYGLDLKGEALGAACFFRDFVAGESLLKPMLAGEDWAETLYLDAVCALQSITEADLGQTAQRVERETADEVLENAYAYFKNHPHPLAERMYQELKAARPEFPPVRFSNGDLWLDNFIIQDKKLAGIIDFQNAAFSDPIFEFLLSFFVSPELSGRGTEERFCRRIGCDPAVLNWYHGLEFFDTWHWVLSSGESFVHHTAESLEANLLEWLH